MSSLYTFFKDRYFLFSVFTLFISVLFVHLIYIILITPAADYIIALSSSNGVAPPRTLSIILKDPEQEICIILFVWSMFFSIYNFLKCEHELINMRKMSANEYSKYFFKSESSSEKYEIKNTVDSLFDVLQMDVSFIKFISWAIPSIGFLGTVRGIGDALGKANEAVSGDITSMTASLGVAFNSTFIALLLSIFLMFIISRLELKQDELIFKLRSKSD
mgnify:CR=1 FL=1